MKRIAFAVPFLVQAFSLLTAPPSQAKLTLKLASVAPPQHAYNLGAREFARLI